jgi:hypothetical protein
MDAGHLAAARRALDEITTSIAEAHARRLAASGAVAAS